MNQETFANTVCVNRCSISLDNDSYQRNTQRERSDSMHVNFERNSNGIDESDVYWHPVSIHQLRNFAEQQ
jgi:hypothetical protein